MTKEISYSNLRVSSKETHFAAIYIEPRILERYSNQIVKNGIYVELNFISEGKTLVSVWGRGDDFIVGDKVPRDFFPNSARTNWFNSSAITSIDQGLLSRLETPWAWSSYNSYDFILNK